MYVFNEQWWTLMQFLWTKLNFILKTPFPLKCKNTTELSGPQLMSDGFEDRGNVSVVREAHILATFLGKLDVGISVPKLKMTIQTVEMQKPASVMV